jgi:hypothetical protein
MIRSAAGLGMFQKVTANEHPSSWQAKKGATIPTPALIV